MKRNRHRYHHLGPSFKGLYNTTTFDDNSTQSATRFLMALDKHVDDPVLDAAILRALNVYLRAQYRTGKWDGAWAQRYPIHVDKKRQKAKREKAKKKRKTGYIGLAYSHLPTFNDGTMRDCIRAMCGAWRQYGKAEYLASVKRALEFILRSQLPDPQAAWAQQYDEDLKPAWARRMEPSSVTGAESAGVVTVLLDMYVEFGDERYLKSAGRAVDWYKRSKIGVGKRGRPRWARFYEIGTNKPLYLTRTYELVYTDDDLPIHYSFKGGWGSKTIRYCEEVKKRGRQYYLDRRGHKKTPKEWAAAARRLRGRVKRVIAGQDELGRWVRIRAKTEQTRDSKGRYIRVVDKKTMLNMMYSRSFVRNMRYLADYITAEQGGAKISAR